MSTPRPSLLARVIRTWLDFTLGLLAVVGVGLVIWIVVSPFYLSQPDRTGTVTVRVALGDGSVLPILPIRAARTDPGAEPSDAYLVKARGELRFASHDRLLVALVASLWLLAVGVVATCTWLLRGVVAEVIEGRPFAPKNAGRLAAIGWIVLATAVVAPILEYLVSRLALGSLESAEIVLSPGFSVSDNALLTALLVLVLAGVFREGARMSEEQSLTV